MAWRRIAPAIISAICKPSSFRELAPIIFLKGRIRFSCLQRSVNRTRKCRQNAGVAPSIIKTSLAISSSLARNVRRMINSATSSGACKFLHCTLMCALFKATARTRKGIWRTSLKKRSFCDVVVNTFASYAVETGSKTG